MAYEIRPARPLDAEIRKVALAQIERALADLRPGEDAGDAALHAGIHEARKRFKKLRGLARLLEPADRGFYEALNGGFRDAARGLSAVRDKAALIEALDDLSASFAETVAADALASVRERLVAERDAAAAGAAGSGPRPGTGSGLGGEVGRAIAALEVARPRVEAFQIGGGRADPKKAARLLASGAARTYNRARKALRRAERTREAEDFHELRKRVKYHWMHLRLVAPAWPEGLRPAEDLAKAIADDLGRDHDLSVLRGEVRADPEAFGSEDTLALLLALLDRRQSELREKSLGAARRLLVDGRKAFERRVDRLYRQTAREAAPPDGMPAETPAAEGRVA
ncbi:CHAD domain-containing protein [Jiella sonneratiae]|uniref:CHAD domain-containing protein n=1 Tax=Jiella sonneratiae TaxID=2816856 RepID=A0ABS3J0J9_9HYPH|nr:CHAD domain-containing protein [Jiella sonneratiae]MBO0903209.1 CHAD domain-containing protein [Jiella sonneratiae]